MGPSTQRQDDQEFITIIAASMSEVMSEFRAQKLAEKDYAIVHKVGGHKFTYANGPEATPLFEGARMIAATFARRVSA